MDIKSLFCSLLLIAGSTLYGKTELTIENATSYSELRHAFKLACKPEMGMSEFDFLYFIEPHIQEAENSLKSFSYCLHHPEKAICKKYLLELVEDVNKELINSVISTPDPWPLIKAIQPSETLKALEKEIEIEYLTQEAKKTFFFIRKMRIQYYRKLSFAEEIRIKRNKNCSFLSTYVGTLIGVFR